MRTSIARFFWTFCGFFVCVGAVRAENFANGLPLQPTRTAEFDTDEGTWMNLDVSPDGKTIAFELLGDLYTVSINGGQARQLTEGMGLDQLPKFAPDGRSILFSTDRSGYMRLWRVDLDGRNARELTWTEREKQFKKTRIAPLTSVSLDDTPLNVTSPDGRYRVRSTRGDWKALMNCDDPVTLDLDNLLDGSTKEKWLTAQIACGRGTMPESAFTPDSRALITSFGGKLWRVEVPSGERKQIPFKAHVKQHLGPLLAFERKLPEFYGPMTYTAKQIRDVRPSPNGKQLALVAFDRIWIADLPSGGGKAGTPRRLTQDEVSEHWPVWSPDGSYISYVTWTDAGGGHGDIRRIPVSATGEARGTREILTQEPGYYDRLNYTPDGTKLVAAWRPLRHLREKNGFSTNDVEARPGAEYVWIPASGGSPVTINPALPDSTIPASARTISQMRYGWPHFVAESGADPKEARLVEYRVGNWWLYPKDDVTGKLISLKLDGSEVKTLLRTDVKPMESETSGRMEEPAGKPIINEMVLSPTGTDVAILSEFDVLHLAKMPAPIPEEKSAGASAAQGAEKKEAEKYFINDPDNKNVRRITPLDAGGAFVSWRADGKVLYYAFGRTFFQYDLQTQHVTRTEVEVTVPRERGRGVVAFRNARLVTMKGNEVIEDGTLVVRDDRIIAVGPSARTPIPKDAKVIDAAGKTILPGYIDLHDHIPHNGTVHRTYSWQLTANLAYGVTTARDPQMLTDDPMAYEDVTRSGRMVGARYFNTGPGISLPSSDQITSLEDARAVMRQYRDYYRVLTWKEYISGDRPVKQWLIMAAREVGINPIVHNQGGVRQALSMVLDGYTEVDHGLNAYPLYRDITELFARSGTVFANANGSGFRRFYAEQMTPEQRARYAHFVPPSPFAKLYESEYLLKPGYTEKEKAEFWRDASQIAKIAKAGGRIGAAHHGDVPGLGTQMEIWANVDAGMPIHQMLQGATIVGARAIGLGNELGSLEAGKIADLQVLDKNPLESVYHTNSIRYVMRDGRLFDSANLDEIHPVERPMARPWWWQ